MATVDNRAARWLANQWEHMGPGAQNYQREWQRDGWESWQQPMQDDWQHDDSWAGAGQTHEQSDSPTDDPDGWPAPDDEGGRRRWRALSDPWGGTKLLSGRHPTKMTEPTPDDDVPDHVVHLILQMCTPMPAALRLYGHPDLLSIAEAINGPDFVPYNDAIFVKKAGIGGSVAWHQDGATHWDHPNWYPGIHGFNFQVQLYATTPANALWIVPGSHAEGRIDIATRVAANEAGERLPDAIPLLTAAGDVTIVSRQMLHGSFPNASPDPRVSITFGFYPHSSVLGVAGGLNIDLDNESSSKKVYDEAHIRRRSAVVQVALDARHQARPHERRYHYAPFADVEDQYRYGPETIESVLSNYTRYDIAL